MKKIIDLFVRIFGKQTEGYCDCYNGIVINNF